MESSLTKQASDFKKKNFANTLTGGIRTKNVKKKEKQKRPLPPSLSLKKCVRKRGRDHTSKNEFNLNLKKARSRFSLLAAIVEHLKACFMSGNTCALTLDEVLEATENSDTSYIDKMWLIETALVSNPRISLNGDKLTYKPIYNITDKRSLFSLLTFQDDNGLGGIFVDDIKDSVPGSEHIIRSLRNHICHVTRKDTDKDVIYLYDSSYVVEIDPEFTKSWKQIGFQGMEDKEIEKSLLIDGLISQKKYNESRKRPNALRQPLSSRDKRPSKISNVHLAEGLLKNYQK